MDVWLYELIHRGNPRDVDFYQSACTGTERVLELGCGTGRILLPLAKAGFQITGLDIHPEMLARIESRLDSQLATNVSLVEADMRTFQIESSFERILIPYSGLFALESDPEVHACLEQVREHLAPNGRLYFDTYVVREDEIKEVLEPEPEFTHTATIWEGGRRVDVEEQALPAPGERNLHIHYRYQIHEADGQESRRVEQMIRHHFLTPTGLRRAVSAAGLTITAEWGDFRGGTAHDEANHFILCARRTA